VADEDESELTVSESTGSDGAEPTAETTQEGRTETSSGEAPAEGFDEATGMELDSENGEFDHAAESFIDVEEDLKGLGKGMRGRGQAIDVERVPAEEVPDDYPAEITTQEALALRLSMVDAENETVVVYFEWPEQGTDDRLARLLKMRDIPMDRFADLHGKSILLTIEDGYYVPVLPKDEPRGDERAFYGILGGLVPSFLIAAAGIFGVGSLVASLPFLVLWLVATFAVLPASVYSDAWHLRTTTDWDGGPLFWTFLALLPAVNVIAVPAYLIIRQNTEPIV